jgi:pimeloyl-ACP methyl ester carboxylesterase
MHGIKIEKDQAVINTSVLNPEGKKTLVMVHGMFGNLSQFYMTIAPGLSKHFKVVLYDIRSHGKSSQHATGYDLISLTDDLDALLEKLQIAKCHILGFSYGALIALKYAMRFREKVEKVIAIEIPPKSLLPWTYKGSYTFKDFMDFASTLTPYVYKNFMRSKRQIDSSYKIYDYIFNHTSFVEDMNRESIFGVNDYYPLDLPVFLFFGKSSPCLPELYRVQYWLRCKEVTIEDGGHGFFMENPEASVKKMNDFLLKIETSVTQEALIK